MKRTIQIYILALLLALPSCAPVGERPRLTVVCTTYPIYLFASSITVGVDGVAVERLDTGSVSCLHDYTLSMGDMKKLERADVIAVNGAGLEDFLEDALATSNALVIDCSEGVDLLESLSHNHEDGEEGHDHGHWDPHYWMDRYNALVMAWNLEGGLFEADRDHALEYRSNAERLDLCLNQYWDAAWEVVTEFASEETSEIPELPGLITFHDGFQYFASSFGLPLLASLEEEAGSEASAREIVEITQRVREYDIPVIFTEVNGSDATAKAISRETGCRVAQLTMIMDGPDNLEAYRDGIVGNIRTIYEASFGREGAAVK